VAEQFPEIVKQAKEIMEKEHRPSALPGFQFPVLGGNKMFYFTRISSLHHLWRH
jgi:hypothetical protein